MTTTRRTPSVSTRSHGGGRHAADEIIGRYLHELDAQPLLQGDRETQAALRLQGLKQQYWRRLFAIAPLRSAMVEVIVAARAQLRGELDLEPLRALSRQRGELAGADVEALLESLAYADGGCELADRLAADVHALADGATPSSLRLRRAVESGALSSASASLHACRAAITAAREAFARANLRLVVTMAHRYQSTGRLPLSDLIQEGNIGLMTAVDRFDPRRGFRFSTYGAWWIRHAISRALSDTGRTVRLPVHVIDLQCRVAKLRREFERANGRAPEQAELAAALGISEAKLRKLDLVMREQSMPLPDDEEGTRDALRDALADDGPASDENLHERRLLDVLERAFETLDDGARDILRRRFGLDGDEPMTLREVGEAYSLSRERIRQLQQGALTRLRGALERDGFARADVCEGREA